MDQLNAGRRFLMVLLGGLAIQILVLVAVAAILGADRAAVEEGPLEFLQEIALVAGALLFFAAAWFLRHAPRMAAIDAGLICAVFFLRELEITATGPLTSYLSSREFRWHESIIVLALLTPYAALRPRLVLELVRYVAKLQAWPFILACLLLVLSWIFDKFGSSYLPYAISRLLEELAESTAYLILTITALHFLQRARFRKSDSARPSSASAANDGFTRIGGRPPAR